MSDKINSRGLLTDVRYSELKTMSNMWLYGAQTSRLRYTLADAQEVTKVNAK
jgi:hypothetical protein